MVWSNPWPHTLKIHRVPMGVYFADTVRAAGGLAGGRPFGIDMSKHKKVEFGTNFLLPGSTI